MNRQDVDVEISSSQSVVRRFDATPEEIESHAELAFHLESGTIAGLTIQGLRLDQDWPATLSKTDVTDALLIGCTIPTAEIAADLVRRGAHVIPEFPGRPYPTHPARLYSADDLVAGFADRGFHDMYDTRVYHHFVKTGGALPPIREALSQRMHDHGIDNALGDLIAEWGDAGGGPIVGIMGGHAEHRGSPGYRAAATIGHGLAAAGCLVVTGGGPGVMEASNLGAFFAEAGPNELASAIDRLAGASRFEDSDHYTRVALEVRQEHLSGCARTADPDPISWALQGGLAVPTWLYGHEPANVFAARIAKYFSNAIREDVILRLARGGIVFAPGAAGTVQEVFQAATKTYYATDGPSGPFVFLDQEYWTKVLPIETLLVPLLARSRTGDTSHLVRITDDPLEAVQIITDHHSGSDR
jgi:predicted Rossmann-fold nucleotide-binding protein